MKLGITKEIDWAYVGALLARGDDKDQSDFLKGFVKECNSWGTSYQVQSQLASVNLLLTKEERETLKMLSYDESAEAL
jgi:hypothetical protein